MVFSIRLIKTQIDVNLGPLCTPAELSRAKEIIGPKMTGLFTTLPAGHIWRDKPEHMQNQEAISLVRTSVLDAFPIDIDLLEFIFSVHDIGRVTEAKVKRGYFFHGHAVESVRLLKEWGVDKCFHPDTWQIISEAIANHDRQKIPMIEADATDLDKLKYAFIVLLRDVDKMATYQEQTSAYLHDPDKKRQEIMQHHFDGERYTIQAANVMQDFLAQRVPKKDEIRSYEGYMLYYLAWIFDINVPAVLQAIVADGCLDDILHYLQAHLQGDQYQGRNTFDLILSTVEQYLNRFQLSVHV